MKMLELVTALAVGVVLNIPAQGQPGSHVPWGIENSVGCVAMKHAVGPSMSESWIVGGNEYYEWVMAVSASYAIGLTGASYSTGQGGFIPNYELMTLGAGIRGKLPMTGKLRLDAVALANVGFWNVHELRSNDVFSVGVITFPVSGEICLRYLMTEKMSLGLYLRGNCIIEKNVIPMFGVGLTTSVQVF
ncbi:MAG: hypothetical protein IJ524_02935 [Bacteroidales bacterium]|nr:hypothetical protein [Bacteroidales bacterium]